MISSFSYDDTAAYLLAITGTVTYPVDNNGDPIVYAVYASCGGSKELVTTFTVAGTTSGTYSFNAGSYSFTGLKKGTSYTVTVYLYNYSTGSALGVNDSVNFTTTGTARPSNWTWSGTIASSYSMSQYNGKPSPMTAAEWISFCTRINEFRAYKDLSAYSFTTPTAGSTVLASVVNQARTAISAISGSGTLPSAATSGGTITAYFFNQLAAALNAVE